jgi:hypothetical protein
LTLRASVKDSEGLIVAVQPETQIVESMVAWVTAGLSAPGVRLGFGSPGRGSADDPPLEGGRTPVAVGTNEAPALAADASPTSTLDATGDAELAMIEAVALAGVVAALASVGAAVTPNGVAVGALGPLLAPLFVPEQPPIAARTRMATTTDAAVPAFARRDRPCHPRETFCSTSDRGGI